MDGVPRDCEEVPKEVKDWGAHLRKMAPEHNEPTWDGCPNPQKRSAA
jgi:hypothetical protein